MNEITTYGYTDKQLAKIYKCARCLLPVRDIAIIIMADEADLRRDINDPTTAAYRHYRRGKGETMLAIRRNEIKLAIDGSPQAVQNAHEYINSMNDDELI